MSTLAIFFVVLSMIMFMMQLTVPVVSPIKLTPDSPQLNIPIYRKPWSSPSNVGVSCKISHHPVFINIGYMVEGSLEVKLPTIWRDEKAVSREKSQKRKDQKKEDAGARKGRKVAKHCVFSWFCGSGGLKSRLAKAAGAETSGEMRDEKLHAVVARSRFRSEKVQNIAASDHFWKFRC